MTPFILLGIGLLMVFLEFFLPGGVMGTLGSCIVIASIFVFAFTYDSLLWISLYSVFALTLLGMTLRFAIWRIRNSEIFCSEDQSGFIASSYDVTAVGKTGVVDSDLRPGGHVLVEGKKHLAISESGYIPKGEQVVVIGGEGESLKVRKKKG